MYEIKVTGMTCGGCVKSITNALKAFDSKADVDVDLGSQIIKIESEKSQDEITSTIEDAGYTVIGSKKM